MYDNMPSTNSITFATDKTASETSAPVSREMTMIHKMLAENAEIASTVEQRLHAVLRPSPPQNASSNPQSDPRSPNSPLTNDLESFKAQLQQLAAHYQDILSRLEV